MITNQLFIVPLLYPNFLTSFPLRYQSVDFTVTSQKNVVPFWQPKGPRLTSADRDEVGVYYLGYDWGLYCNMTEVAGPCEAERAARDCQIKRNSRCETDVPKGLIIYMLNS